MLCNRMIHIPLTILKTWLVQPFYSSDRLGCMGPCLVSNSYGMFLSFEIFTKCIEEFWQFLKKGKDRNGYFQMTDLGNHSRLVHQSPLRITFSSLNIQLSKLSRFPVNNRTNPLSLFALQVMSLFQSRSHSFQICSWPIFLNCRRHGCRNTRLAGRVRIAGKLYRVFAAFNDLRFQIQLRGLHEEWGNERVN